MNDVGDPRRLSRLPDATRQPHASSERGLSADGVELREGAGVSGPDLCAAQHIDLAVYRPQGPVLPVERVANGLEDFRDGIGERGRLAQRTGNLMLSRQPPLGQLRYASRSRVRCHRPGLAIITRTHTAEPVPSRGPQGQLSWRCGSTRTYQR